ncbi:sn-glycerol-3-phosphate ABC transporter ATP-binding protein UgpC [Roseibacterium sp. SDUM158017]|uniref:ABC transporter ATP-binding protein n=1 Tax=Roseicyclus salinarum TaxID=3036773 RepID=UPI002415293C|nr:sn-glycerol-3-phosphate ABC transporter ATP-binding protein UgpC [Roseibacterium sp. SDUM158017]MDG4649558.1 sn-glycerol-3-phosphate ABC transporter ATP-binding protein UgpC [Roseibacterium sp. SDUM158017]
MAEVAIRSLRKNYGAVEVIHGIDLEIGRGEFVVLVGPSGCGKSTLLRMIAGLEEVTDGDILIGDRRVNHLSPNERDIAMVFQSYALYPHKTVRANMGFSLKLRKMDRGEIDRRVNEAAEILGLTPYLDRYPRALSGGQRQRVAMGRAIVRNPQVFLFDEPLSNLDAKLRVQMRTEIRELHQRLKTTTVYVTHDQIEAMTMADKIVVLNGGNVEQVGSPLELYDSPRNTFVASFIGSPAMNLMAGGVLGVEGGTARIDLGQGSVVEMRAPPGLGAGAKVTLGARPEHLRLADDGLPVTVRVVEPTGSETHVVCKFQDREITAIFRDRVTLRPGDTATLAPETESLHIFDGETGDRLGAAS